MAQEEQPGTTAASAGGVSRRRALLAGAGLAAAGVAVGAGVPSVVSGIAEAGGPVTNPADPVMVHLRDAGSGELDVFVGDRRIQVTDRAFTARLVKIVDAA
ncbi:hypothetical protein [Amycolatopsis sp. NPDC021455]|uniref:hypothetical protein n=1 Tax=Amycolatopsis sp. NPDC021455 TaxID=3154901 RepID=UPI0033C687CC